MVHDADPSGLFEMGAPKDEHDGEVFEIISVLMESNGPAMLGKKLERVFEVWREGVPDCSKDYWEEMALPIWEAWLEYSLG